MRFTAISFFVKITVPTPLWAFPISTGNQNNSAFGRTGQPMNNRCRPPTHNRSLSRSSMSPSSTFESPNDDTITAATSATAALTAAFTLTHSQTTAVPGSELPHLPPHLLPLPDFTHRSPNLYLYALGECSFLSQSFSFSSSSHDMPYSLSLSSSSSSAWSSWNGWIHTASICWCIQPHWIHKLTLFQLKQHNYLQNGSVKDWKPLCILNEGVWCGQSLGYRGKLLSEDAIWLFV